MEFPKEGFVMAVRLISAAVGIVIGVSILILDNNFVYCAVISFLSAAAVWELTRAIKCEKFPVLRWTSVIFGAIYPTIIIIKDLKFLSVPLAMAYVIMMALIMLKLHSEVKFEQVLACGCSGGLLPVSLSCIVLLRYSPCGEPLGIFTVLFLLFCAWFGDSGAYFVGTFFGKHKLCPKISPKKTVEGLIGGVVTVGIIAGITLLIYNSFILSERQLNYFVLIPTAMVASLVGVVGDLSASVIKREYDVKDFGNIMPGHGGVIDRFDSVIFVAPFLYISMLYLGDLIYF